MSEIVFSAPPDNLFSDIFRTFFRQVSDILSTFPFSGLSNDLPITLLKRNHLGRSKLTSIKKIKWPNDLKMAIFLPIVLSVSFGRGKRKTTSRNKSDLLRSKITSKVVIFFSLTEAPLPDPNPTPPNTLKRTRNRAETEPNGAKRSRNGAKRSRNGPKSSFSGWDGRGVCRGRGGGGVVREKENHYSKDS